MHWLARLGVLLLALTISASRLEAIPSEGLDGISFADHPHMLFVPIEEIASSLRWEMQLDQESGQISLNGHLLDAAHLRKLTDGTLLVPLDELQRAGATITWSNDGMQALVASDHTKIAIPFANKRVEVDLANQRLRLSGIATRPRQRHQHRTRGQEDAFGRIQGWAGQIADAPLTALPQRTNAVECTGAREYFHSRIPEGPPTSLLARLHSPAADRRQSGEVVLQLDRSGHTRQY